MSNGKSEPKKKGRPTKYTDDLALEICARLSKGETLLSICRSDHMPHRVTVYDWLWDKRHEEFHNMYARARRVQAHGYVDEIIEISDNKQNDSYCDEYGNEKPNHEYMQRSRLRVDSRKWFASKVMPKIYGDKLELSGDEDNPLRNHHTHELDFTNMTEEERLQAISGIVKGK